MAFAPLKRFHYFFIACLAVKFFFVLFAFLKTITGPLDDAVVAATLLSYTYGFATAGMACGYRNRTPDSRGFCISGFAFFTGLLPAPWRKDQKPVHAAGNGMPGLVQYKILFGSPEPAVSRYIAEARHLGFAISDQFMAPLIYMRTGLPALFQMGFRSFQQPINWIYAILYLIQWGLLYLVYTTFRGSAADRKRPKSVVSAPVHSSGSPAALPARHRLRAVVVVHLHHGPAADRAAGELFGGLSGSRNPWIYRALLIGLPLFFLLIRIPLYTVSHQNSLLNYLKEFTIYSKVAGFRY